MSDGSEKRPLTKMLWSVSIKTRTFASVNTCNGSFQSCLKLLKQYRTIEQMCSDAHSITLTPTFVMFDVDMHNLIDKALKSMYVILKSIMFTWTLQYCLLYSK